MGFQVFWMARSFMVVTMSKDGSTERWVGRNIDTPFETTNELDPLKGLTRLLTLVEVMKKGGENL